jgi:hypothetical protein
MFGRITGTHRFHRVLVRRGLAPDRRLHPSRVDPV